MSKKVSRKQVKKEWFTAAGEPVPDSAVSGYDKRKEKVVCSLVEFAEEIFQRLEQFKAGAYSDCDALYEERLRSQGIGTGARKGNYVMYNYDKSLKIEMAVNSSMKFSDDITIAQELLNEYIDEATETASDDLREIVRNSFTSKRGNIDKARVLGLFQYKVKHPKWKRAMDLIKSSLVVADSKRYMSFYRRDENGEYKQINLNFSTL